VTPKEGVDGVTTDFIAHRVSKGRHLRCHVVAMEQYAKAMLKREVKCGICRSQLVPIAPDTEPMLTHLGIVKENYSALSQLWNPAFEILLHIIVEMAAVNMLTFPLNQGRLELESPGRV
jgi:hypothetical protein